MPNANLGFKKIALSLILFTFVVWAGKELYVKLIDPPPKNIEEVVEEAMKAGNVSFKEIKPTFQLARNNNSNKVENLYRGQIAMPLIPPKVTNLKRTQPKPQPTQAKKEEEPKIENKVETASEEKIENNTPIEEKTNPTGYGYAYSNAAPSQLNNQSLTSSSSSSNAGNYISSEKTNKTSSINNAIYPGDRLKFNLPCESEVSFGSKGCDNGNLLVLVPNFRRSKEVVLRIDSQGTQYSKKYTLSKLAIIEDNETLLAFSKKRSINKPKKLIASKTNKEKPKLKNVVRKLASLSSQKFSLFDIFGGNSTMNIYIDSLTIVGKSQFTPDGGYILTPLLKGSDLNLAFIDRKAGRPIEISIFENGNAKGKASFFNLQMENNAGSVYLEVINDNYVVAMNDISNTATLFKLKYDPNTFQLIGIDEISRIDWYCLEDSCLILPQGHKLFYYDKASSSLITAIETQSGVKIYASKMSGAASLKGNLSFMPINIFSVDSAIYVLNDKANLVLKLAFDYNSKLITSLSQTFNSTKKAISSFEGKNIVQIALVLQNQLSFEDYYINITSQGNYSKMKTQ